MLEPIEDLPAGVIGFDVVGRVEVEDYTGTLIPAVEQADAATGVRLVLVFERFEGFGSGAMWEDLKFGAGHLHGWKRTALVTDVPWMSHLTAVFGWMTPGEFRRFPLARRADAIAWVAEGA